MILYYFNTDRKEEKMAINCMYFARRNKVVIVYDMDDNEHRIDMDVVIGIKS